MIAKLHPLFIILAVVIPMLIGYHYAKEVFSPLGSPNGSVESSSLETVEYQIGEE